MFFMDAMDFIMPLMFIAIFALPMVITGAISVLCFKSIAANMNLRRSNDYEESYTEENRIEESVMEESAMEDSMNEMPEENTFCDSYPYSYMPMSKEERKFRMAQRILGAFLVLFMGGTCTFMAFHLMGSSDTLGSMSTMSLPVMIGFVILFPCAFAFTIVTKIANTYRRARLYGNHSTRFFF